MSQKIKQEIKKVRNCREKQLNEYHNYFSDFHYGFKYDIPVKGFLKFIMEKEHINKKNPIIRFLKKYDYVWKKYKNVYISNFPLEQWRIAKKAIEIAKKYIDDYNCQYLKETLQELTKCEIQKDGKNPCNVICEECGRENILEAKYCNECGEEFD